MNIRRERLVELLSDYIGEYSKAHYRALLNTRPEILRDAIRVALFWRRGFRSHRHN